MVTSGGAWVQVDGSVAAKQGIRFVFQDGSRIIFRISVRAMRLLSLSQPNTRILCGTVALVVC